MSYSLEINLQILYFYYSILSPLVAMPNRDRQIFLTWYPFYQTFRLKGSGSIYYNDTRLHYDIRRSKHESYLDSIDRGTALHGNGDVKGD